MHSQILLLLLLIVTESKFLYLSNIKHCYCIIHVLTDVEVLMVPQNEVVYLCPGEHHSIVCSTNQSYLQWIVTVPQDSIVYQSSRLISVFLRLGSYIWRHVGDTTINYTKNSELGVLPLTSTLLINCVTTNFNGTIITCYSIFEDIILSISSIDVINGKILSPVQIDSESINNGVIII